MEGRRKLEHDLSCCLIPITINRRLPYVCLFCLFLCVFVWMAFARIYSTLCALACVCVCVYMCVLSMNASVCCLSPCALLRPSSICDFLLFWQYTLFMYVSPCRHKLTLIYQTVSEQNKWAHTVRSSQCNFLRFQTFAVSMWPTIKSHQDSARVCVNVFHQRWKTYNNLMHLSPRIDLLPHPQHCRGNRFPTSSQPCSAAAIPLNLPSRRPHLRERGEKREEGRQTHREREREK